MEPILLLLTGMFSGFTLGWVAHGVLTKRWPPGGNGKGGLT